MLTIFKPVGPITFPFGGALAYRWNMCSGQVYPDKLYQDEVVPYITEYAERTRYRYIPLDSLRRLYWGVNVYGDLAEYEVTTSSLERRKPKRDKETFAAFEKAKADGNIVLNPLSVYRLKGAATPNLYPGSRGKFINVRALSSEEFPNDTKPGLCQRMFHKIPSLELDAWQMDFQGTLEQLSNVTATNVAKQDLDSIMLDVIQFSRNPVNSGLVTKVVSEANSATFDLGTEIGEMPETVKMVLNFVMEGIKLLLRAKKDIKQQLSSGMVTKDAASLWMGYRYGLMPMVYSINDGLDLLAMESRKFQSFRGRIDIPFEKFSARGYECVSAPNIQNRMFLKYGYDLDSPIHQGLKLNLAATAWELIPLSFVFDWFFQVGDYLTAYFTPGNVNKIGCTYSYKTEGQFIFEKKETESLITIDAEIYHCDVINPDSFIGIHSDVFVSFKRSMDALALLWLIFKKNPKH